MSVTPKDLAAVIPAAGFSSRMHDYKPLLPLGPRTILEQAVTLFKSRGVEKIIVVTGHNRELLEPVIRNCGATPVFNPGYADGMRGSIQTGAANIPADAKGFFLLPVDIAAVRPGTVQALFEAFRASPAPAPVIFPEFQGETGHPPLIPSRFIPDILHLDGDQTLRDLLLSPKTPQKCIKVHDRGILMDADTKEDYVGMQNKFTTRDIPDRLECQSIIDTVLPAQDPIRSHLERVADTALTLTRAIRQCCHDPQLNPHLIRAGALLHDIKRKQKDHAAVGGEYIKALGFPRVASIVSRHMDIGELTGPLTEAQVVYFADKICNGPRIQPDYAARFEKKAKTVPEARDKIMNRYEATRRIQRRIQALCQRPVTDILG